MISKLSLGFSPLVLLMACGGVVRLEGDRGSNDYDSGVTGSGATASGIGGSVSRGGGIPGRAGTGPTYGGASSGGRSGATGGRPAAGGFAGTGAVGGFAGAACCLAAAVCDPGDKQMGPADKCPVGFDCYQRSVCCSTIQCISIKTCGAPPACKPGEAQMMGACPYPCYSVSSCGVTISCMPMVYPTYDGGAPPTCNAATEYNRNYVGLSQAQCAAIDFGCPNFTAGFSNACGCGCEQNPGCPEWVNCMPSGAPPDRFCSDAGIAQCPYTKRAL